MATRVELRQCCDELNIDSNNLSSEEMTEAIRAEFDRLYQNRKARISPEWFSETLIKFITEEYDWVLVTKDKKEIDLMEYKRLKEEKNVE